MSDIYAAAVSAIAAIYPATPEVYALPQWRAAERTIESAARRGDVRLLVAAVATFESTARALFTAQAGEAACDHGDDHEIRAWRAEHPERLCAKCLFERWR